MTITTETRIQIINRDQKDIQSRPLWGAGHLQDYNAAQDKQSEEQGIYQKSVLEGGMK